MKQHWEALRARYQALSRRERVLVLLASLGLVYGAADFALLEPQRRAGELASTQRRDVEAQIAELGQRAREISQAFASDPDRELRRRQAELEQQLAVLDQQLAERTVNLIAPQRMVGLLEDLLREGGDLELLRLESLPAEPLFEDPDSSARAEASSRSQVFKHGFVVELEGAYLSTLRYLRAMERLPWHLVWDRLHYQVLEHPKARVQIEIHTLSTREGWIGV